LSHLTPDQATLIVRETGLRTLASEHPVTKRVIEAIPADRADYRPDSIAMSAIDLAWHLVGAEHRFLDAVISGAFDDSDTKRPASIVTPADVVARHSEQFAADMDRLKMLPGERLLRKVDFRGLFQLPAFAYIQIAINHSIHHRGQLSMYLRPMGARVPSIYGESYDTRQDRP
jgi:uncharacterized damage-inducible protein DinB